MKIKNIWLMALMGLLFISCQGSRSNSPSNCAPTSPLSPSSLVKFLTTGETNKKAMLVATSKGQVRTFPLNLVGNTIANTKLDLPGGLWNFQLFIYSEYDGKEIPTAYVAFGEQNTSGCFADLNFTRDDFLFDEPPPSEPNPFLTPNISLTEGCEKKFDCDGDGVPNYWEIVGRSNPFSADSVPPKGPIIDLISPAPNETALGITLIQAEAYSVGRGVKDLSLITPSGQRDEDGRPEYVKVFWDTNSIQYGKFNLQLITTDNEGNVNQFNREILVANGFLKSFTTLNGQDSHENITLSWQTDRTGNVVTSSVNLFEGKFCAGTPMTQEPLQGDATHVVIPANTLEKFHDYSYLLTLNNGGQILNYLCENFATGDAGLVAWWRFDGDNKDRIKDWSPSGNDGVPFNMTPNSFVQGVAEDGLLFDGIDDYVKTGTANLPSSNTEGTWEMWVKLLEPQTASSVMYGTSPDENGALLSLTIATDVKDNFLGLSAFINGKGDVPHLENFNSDLGIWQQIVLTKSLDGVWKFYVNGVLIEAFVNQGEWNNTGSTLGYLLGHSYPYFYGVLDEVKIYKRMLTREEIVKSCHNIDAFSQQCASLDTPHYLSPILAPGQKLPPGNVYLSWNLGESNGSYKLCYTDNTASNINFTQNIFQNESCPHETGPFIDNFYNLSLPLPYTSYRFKVGKCLNGLCNQVLYGPVWELETDDSLMGWWKFDEEMGLNVADASRFHDTATLQSVNGTSVSSHVEGIKGRALSFDGNDDYVEIPMAPQLDFASGEFTLETWVNVDSDTQNNQTPLISSANTANYTQQTTLRAFNGENMGRFFARDIEGQFFSINGEASLSRETWQHLVVTRSGIHSRLFVNGVFSSGDDVGGINDLTPMGAWNLGRFFNQPCCGDSFFKGKMDEVKFYNKALSPEEVLNQCLTLDPTGLICRH